jgi:hypothetical protein
VASQVGVRANAGPLCISRFNTIKAGKTLIAAFRMFSQPKPAQDQEVSPGAALMALVQECGRSLIGISGLICGEPTLYAVYHRQARRAEARCRAER